MVQKRQTTQWKPLGFPGHLPGKLIRFGTLAPSLTLLLHLSPGCTTNQDWFESGHRHGKNARFSDQLSLKSSLNHYDTVLKAHIHNENPSLTPEEVDLLTGTIIREALYLRIPAHLKIEGKSVNPVFFLASIVQIESSFNRYAVSISNARGLMQVKPETADWISYRLGLKNRSNHLFHTRVNIRIGMEYMRYLLQEMKDIRLATLAYNAGPGAVQRGRYDEHYWEKALKAYHSMESLSAENPTGMRIALASYN